MATVTIDRGLVERCAGFALAAIGREYPNHLSLHLARDEDLAPPRRLTPMFYGAFDWHSAVHGHWTLVRAARLLGGGDTAAAARATLHRSLTPAHVAGELAFLAAPGRRGFERPYGLAWLLQLAAELREWQDPDAARWRDTLAPLEAHAAGVIGEWLPKLPWPVRVGEHAQTAFALGLVLDWARTRGDEVLAQRIAERAGHWFGADRAAPVAYEPSGHDFLSPALGEADLMRRVLRTDAFTPWLHGFLPQPGSGVFTGWLEPVTSPDPTDGKLSHLDGLNLSRAWMLEGIAAALPAGDPFVTPLRDAARRHRSRGLAALDPDAYAGAHWFGSFALYLVTGRGRG